MATTKVNNQNESVNSQYAAVAKYAGEVYQTMTVARDDETRMTAAQVAKAIYKTVFFNTDNGEEDQQHTIEAPGMTLTTTPRMVFGQLAELESMLKIKKADRMTFAHAYELLKAEQVEASCFIPVDIATLCKYAADDELRPVMCGVCFDFEQLAIVSSNGHVLVAVPMNAGAGTGRWIVPQKFLEAHAGGIIQFTTIDGVQYAYVCQERTRLIEGRYPNWQSVIPKCDTAPIHIGSAWKEFVQKCCMLGKVNEVCGKIVITGRSYSKTITIIGRNEVFGTEQRAEVCIDGEIPYDFSVSMKGTLFKSYPPFTDMYLHDTSRAALFTDGVCVMLQMPMVLMDDEGKAMNVTTNWKATPIKEEFVPSVLKKAEKPKAEDKQADAKPEPVCEKPKAEKPKAKKPTKKVEDKVVVCSVPKEPKAEATPTPAAPAPAEPKVIAIGTEVCLKGDATKEVWRVEMMSEQRAILKSIDNPSHRRVEKRENLYVAGTEEPVTVSGERVAVSEEPVCEPTTEAPADVKPETPETPETTEAVAIGAVYVCSYSEKAILVFGDTKKYRKALKKYGTWIAKYEGWCLSKKRMDYVKRVVGDKLQETTTMPQAKVSTKNAA